MREGIRKKRTVLIGLAAGAFLLASTSMAFALGREAKNVILMISDGQGFNTVKATEYYTGKKGVYERFGHKGLSKYTLRSMFGNRTYKVKDIDGYIIGENDGH